MSEDQDLGQSNRLAAETFMPIMVEAFHDGLREVASLSRWLLATLVVVNGAGAIAVLPLQITTGLKLGGPEPSSSVSWRHWARGFGPSMPSSA